MMGPEIMAKIPNNITLTLHHVKLPEKPTGNSRGWKYSVEFPSGQNWVKFPDFNLQNYMLGDLNVVACTKGCAHGSSNKILS